MKRQLAEAKEEYDSLSRRCVSIEKETRGAFRKKMKRVSYPSLIKRLSLVFEKNGNTMSNLQAVYNKILTLLHSIEPNDNFLNQIRLPKLTDKELLSLSLAAESLGIDSEHFLFKQLPPEVHGRIERSV